MTKTLARPLTEIPLNDFCSVSLQRTLRIPDDGNDYPLPPGLGAMTAYEVDEDEYVVPMHRSEAVWFSFDGPSWRPHALKIGLGTIDALTGTAFDPMALGAGKGKKQDHVVVGEQPWLDGINSGEGFVRQFVAAALGEGKTVEEQLTDEPVEGGVRFVLFEPRKDKFPTEPPVVRFRGEMYSMVGAAPAAAPDAMGLAAGGRITQDIRADEHRPRTWKKLPARTVRIELVDALAFEAVTGIPAPHPAPDAHSYTSHGLPWFDLLDPTGTDIKAAKRLKQVKSLADLEGRTKNDVPLPIPEAQVRKLLRLRNS